MLDVVIKDFLPEFDPAHTGLFIGHAANPWGMKNFWRYNEKNIDLNRNFITVMKIVCSIRVQAMNRQKKF